MIKEVCSPISRRSTAPLPKSPGAFSDPGNIKRPARTDEVTKAPPGAVREAPETAQSKTAPTVPPT